MTTYTAHAASVATSTLLEPLRQSAGCSGSHHMAVVLRSIPQECSLGRKHVWFQPKFILEPRVCTKNPSQRKAIMSWKKSIHLDFGSSNSNESGPYPHVATSCDFKLSLGENLSFWPRAHTSTWILGERQRIAWCATQGKRMWEVCRFVSSRAWGFIVILCDIA